MRVKDFSPALLLFSLVTLFSCIDDKDYQPDSVEANPSLALPLGTGTLSLQNFLSDKDSANVRTYDDGLLYFYYEEQLKSQAITTLFEFPNRNLNKQINLPATTIPANVEVTLNTISQEFDFAYEPERINEILLKAGTLQLASGLNPNQAALELTVEISIPGFALNGVPLKQTFKTGQTPVLALAGYKATLNQNKFNVDLKIKVKNNSNSAKSLTNAKLDLTLNFADMDFSFMRGFFGQQMADLPESTVEVGTFESSLEDVNISFAEPKITFDVLNGYGIPVRVHFNALEARREGQNFPQLEINPSSPVTVANPTIPGNIASTAVSVVNAATLLELQPTSFYYNMSASINDGLNTGNNFSYDTSTLRVNMKVEMPLYAKASNIQIKDTTDLDLSDVKDSEITSAFIRVNSSNGLPLDAALQIYITDDKYNIIDSLFPETDNQVLEGAETGSDGTPTNPGILSKDISLDKAKLTKILSGKYLIIVATLNTSDNPKFVKFRVTDKLTVKLGLNANLKMKFEL